MQQFRELSQQDTFQKIFTWLVMAYAFCIPWSIAGVSLLQGLMIIAFLFYLPRLNFHEMLEKLKQSKPIVALFAFVLLSFISLTWSSDKDFALEYLGGYYHFIIIPIIYLLLDTSRIKHVFSAFLISMVITELMAIGIFLEIFQFNNIPPHDPSPFMNHTDFSLYLAFTSVLILTRLDLHNSRNYKILYGILLAITFFSLVISAGRTGQIIFLVIFPLYLFLYFRDKIRFALSILVGLLVLVSVSYFTIPAFKNRIDYTVFDLKDSVTTKEYDASFGMRVALWRVGSGIFIEHFPLGTGIGDERTGIKEQMDNLKFEKLVSTTYEEMETKGYIDFHSVFIQALVQMGIPGLLSLWYIFYSVFQVKHETRRYTSIKVVFLISCILYGAANNLLHTFFPVTFFVFFLSLLIAKSRDELAPYENSEK